jgi:hypothetical protein
MAYGVGNIVEFFYVFIAGRRATPSPTKPGHTGPYKERVLILNPMYNNLMHGLDMEMLSDAEVETLEAVLDPDQEGKHHRIPIVNDTLARMKPWEEIRNPLAFYTKFVKPFLGGKDAYRTYNPGLMRDVIVLKKTDIKGNVVNSNPLFKKVEAKTDGEQQVAAGPEVKDYGKAWLSPIGNKVRKPRVTKGKVVRPKRKGR